jgi:hypothetical protein
LVKDIEKWAAETANDHTSQLIDTTSTTMSVANYYNTPINGPSSPWYYPKTRTPAKQSQCSASLYTPETEVISPSWPILDNESQQNNSPINFIPEFPEWEMPSLQSERQLTVNETQSTATQSTTADSQDQANGKYSQFWRYDPDLNNQNTDADLSNTHTDYDIKLTTRQENTLRELLR